MADLPQSAFQGPLAPKMGLGDSFKSPLQENDDGTSSPKPKGRGISKLIPFGAIALALLVLPLTISQLNQQQDIRQRASGPVPPISPTDIPTLSPTTAPFEEEISSPSATPEMIEDNL